MCSFTSSHLRRPHPHLTLVPRRKKATTNFHQQYASRACCRGPPSTTVGGRDFAIGDGLAASALLDRWRPRQGQLGHGGAVQPLSAIIKTGPFKTYTPPNPYSLLRVKATLKSVLDDIASDEDDALSSIGDRSPFPFSMTAER
jgi:hypothetical protein